MKNNIKTREQLLQELEKSKKRIVELGKSEAEYKQAEKELKESEERFRDIIEMSPAGIATISLTGFMTSCNAAFLELTGYKYDDFIGKHFTKLPTLRLKDIPKYIRLMESLIKGEPLKPFEFNWVHKNGEVLLGEARLSILRKKGKISGFQVIAIDITERKHAEEELLYSEEKHRTLFETMAQGVVYQDKYGEIISANPAAERILGLTLDQMQDRKSIDPRWRAIHEDGSDFPGDTHPAMIALKTGKEVNNVKMGVFNPALDEFRWININARLKFRSGEDAPIQAYTTFDDFTERKQMEQLIHTQAEVTQNMAEGAYIVGLNDVIIRWTSPRFEKMFGYESGEMIGKHASIVNAKDYLTPVEKVDKIMEVLHKTGEWHGEVKNIKKDGIQFWCYASVSTFTHQDYGEVLLAVHTDITQRKQAEEELKENMRQLERFNRLTVGRELKMIELKKEINELLREAGRIEKYKISSKE